MKVQYGHEPCGILYFGGNYIKPIQDVTGRTAIEIPPMVGTINKASRKHVALYSFISRKY
ncbi:MAG TPA: hypothetical protein VEH06_17495 [Candidatus Bathyarchaeia archaeon]|nr:hypothetical protein [Candidatus Bathyarchaeia archaeon]